MMVAEKEPLPAAAALRGRIQADAPLGPTTWFRVGGPAQWLVRPADIDDLCHFLAALPHTVPVVTIGAASNLIVRDGGVRGVVVKLARGFTAIETDGNGIVAGAAALDVTVAEHAAAVGLAGLEFLSGIPGSIGGAIAMNAGAYGSDVAGCLDWAEVATRDGQLLRLPAQALSLSYRHAALPPGGVVVRARFRATPGEPAAIAARMAAIRDAREASQPVRARTGGSTFRNPTAAESSLKAWELIDAAGCRGLVRGGAQVNEKHCNFLINTGTATAADIEGLGEDVRTRVRAMSGVDLHWEIRRLGIALKDPSMKEHGA
jgi:UDP-N-acetylmuramate dehydrogenase